MTTLWQHLTPAHLSHTAPMPAFSRYLHTPTTQAQLTTGDHNHQYPHAVHHTLHNMGLPQLLANPPNDPLGKDGNSCLTMWHTVQLNQLLASVNGTLAVGVGMNYLAMLPAFIAGTATQLSWLFDKIHNGNFVGMLRSDGEDGSDTPTYTASNTLTGQKTLPFIRAGIASWNAGTTQRAVTLVRQYAQSCQLSGQSILHLGSNADHLLRMKAMEWLVTAITLKTTALLNRVGSGAGFYASVAKYGSSLLAEHVVNEGRLLRGGACFDNPPAVPSIGARCYFVWHI